MNLNDSLYILLSSGERDINGNARDTRVVHSLLISCICRARRVAASPPPVVKNALRSIFNHYFVFKLYNRLFDNNLQIAVILSDNSVNIFQFNFY